MMMMVSIIRALVKLEALAVDNGGSALVVLLLGDPSWPPSPPSSRCGSPSRSTTSAAPPLSTASASNSSIHTDDKPAQPSSLCNIYQYQGILCPDQYQWICKNIEIYEIKKKLKFEERERDKRFKQCNEDLIWQE